MGTFAYIARNASGKRVAGRLNGGSSKAVLAELHARNLAPVSVEEVRETSMVQRRVSARQLAQAYRQLADLLRAGVPLLRALKLLGRSKAAPRLAKVINEVADEVADGSRLADAMAERSDVFPDVQVAMIRAGERGGFLEAVLARMGDFLEHQADMRAKVLGNLIYPCVLLVLGLGILILAMVFIVPQFQDFYSEIELPLATHVLLASSDFVINTWYFALMLLGALAAGLWWVVQQPGVRRGMVVWQMRLPKIGPLMQSIAIARFTRILGTLLENGIPLLQAMQISRDAAGNVLLAEAIDDAIESVRAGESLAEPLGTSGLFGDDVVEMISVGESANNLSVVLVTIAETIEKRVDRMLTVVMRLMEPLLLLGLAGVVLFVFVALVVPMLRMSAAM